MNRRSLIRSRERFRPGVLIVTALFAITNTALVPSMAFAQSTTQSTNGLDGAPISSGPSQNAAANQAQNNNNSASQIAQAIGQGLLGAGTAMAPGCCSTGGCCGTAMMLIAMGLLGLAQSGANKSAAGQHGYNGSLNTSNTGGTGTGTGQDGTSNPTTVDTAKIGGKDLTDKLASYGVKYDTSSGKFTLPNGKSFSTGDIMNPGAMANAGVSSADYQKVMGMAKAAEAKAVADLEKLGAHTAASGFDGGGGGGSSPSTSTTVEEVTGGGGSAKPRAPTSVAGMVKNYNGEMIGVSGDNIFEMMARRYREKASKDNFLPPEASPEAINN